MARAFFYLIDGLTSEKAVRLKRALEQVTDIIGVIVRPSHGVLEVQSNRDVEDEVKMACSLAGTSFRVRIKKRSLF